MLIVNKTADDQLTSQEFNQIPDEIESVISDTGQSPTLDAIQLGHGIATYVGYADFYTASGPADEIVLSAVGDVEPPTAIGTGMRIRFVPSLTNTSTVQVNLATLGLENLVHSDGSVLAAGDLVTTRVYEAWYDGTDFVLTDALRATEDETIIGEWTFDNNVNVGDTSDIQLLQDVGGSDNSRLVGQRDDTTFAILAEFNNFYEVVALGDDAETTVLRSNGDVQFNNHAGAQNPNLHALTPWACGRVNGSADTTIVDFNILSVTSSNAGKYVITMNTGFTSGQGAILVTCENGINRACIAIARQTATTTIEVETFLQSTTIGNGFTPVDSSFSIVVYNLSAL